MLKFPESFEHKPVAFVGEANGAWGAVRSVEQLIQIFHYRNAHVFPDRVFIPDIRSRFNEKGELTDAAIAQRLHKQAVGFGQFVLRFQAGSAA
jgi:NAD(P)H-dependent FMN reductase